MINIAIEALNTSSGGGLTYLSQLLANLDPKPNHIKSVLLISNPSTLKLLPDYPWLKKYSPFDHNASLLQRTAWHVFHLSSFLTLHGCDILYLPNGICLTSFRPFISFHQNLLPFVFREMLRYGASLTTLRLFVLRILQRYSMHYASACFFPSKASLDLINRRHPSILSKSYCIYHGNEHLQPAIPSSPPLINLSNPINVIYVSTLDVYKHQDRIVHAVSLLRKSLSLDIRLDFVGSGYPAYDRKLKHIASKLDPCGSWITFHPYASKTKLKSLYSTSHIAVWASSCETFGIILLEYMVYRLPIVSVRHPVHQEILGSNAFFC